MLSQAFSIFVECVRKDRIQVIEVSGGDRVTRVHNVHDDTRDAGGGLTHRAVVRVRGISVISFTKSAVLDANQSEAGRCRDGKSK